MKLQISKIRLDSDLKIAELDNAIYAKVKQINAEKNKRLVTIAQKKAANHKINQIKYRQVKIII